MSKVIIDTNALMAIGEFKLDIFLELNRILDDLPQFFTLSKVIEELNKIFQEQRGKYKLAAKLALSIIDSKTKNKQMEIIPCSGDADDLLAKYSKKGYLILTQDVLLKKRLTKPYLTIRQKRKVIMIR